MAKKSKKKASRQPVKAKKTAARQTAKTAARKTARNTNAAKKKAAKKKTARKAATASRSARTGAAKNAGTRKAAKKAGTKTLKSPAAIQARQAAAARTATALGKRPNLERERRTIREEEEMVPSPPSSLNMDRTASAVRTGRAEFEQRLREHTSTGPAMTGGDVDADWEDAEAVGDEAPGGDNPTPDQDIVDEIGRAVGIEYDDDEELQGGEEVAERDRHRWELDPASKEEFEDE
jgi:hypothetical protein